MQFSINEWRVCWAQTGVKLAAHTIKLTRVRPLERIDRLLFVADNENSARNLVACSLSSGDFRGEPFNHIPLRWAGVLRFIDKNMIDATVEFIKHPLRHFGIGKQVARFQNEVIKIKPTACLFACLVSFEKRRSEAIQMKRLLHGSEFEPRATRCFNP